MCACMLGTMGPWESDALFGGALPAVSRPRCRKIARAPLMATGSPVPSADSKNESWGVGVGVSPEFLNFSRHFLSVRRDARVKWLFTFWFAHCRLCASRSAVRAELVSS